MRPTRIIAGAVLLVAAFGDSASAAAGERVDLPIRGKTMALTIYRPARPTSAVKGTVVLASGDVGWVGLAVSMAGFLTDDGYIVVGINTRQYLSAFTNRNSHLTTSDVPLDYAQISNYLRGRALLSAPVIVSGVSEGAALAVLAASAPANHSWIAGVITMGLPASAELAWRWSDFTTWITKKGADEPSFAPRDFIHSISPLPLWMIQSTTDEYVTEAEYRELEAAARAPKRLILIDAKNHRFTNRLSDLHREFLAALSAVRAGSSPASSRNIH